jgi:hypothetical protein
MSEKLKRSVELSKKELRFLVEAVKKHETKTAAAIALGISKDVLDRAIAFGSCSEKTYNILFASSKMVA